MDANECGKSRVRGLMIDWCRELSSLEKVLS